MYALCVCNNVRGYARLQITPYFTLMFKELYGVGLGILMIQIYLRVWGSVCVCVRGNVCLCVLQIKHD